MKLFSIYSLIAVAISQTITPSWTPSATPMGSSMLTYSLTFPNSDPMKAVRAEYLEYLITAIACSANVPAELVYISYVRAPNVTNRLRRLQVPSSPNMLVAIYYLSPRPAKPTDIYFRPYVSIISSSSASASSILVGNSNGTIQGSTSLPTISTGGIVGIVIGLIATTALVAGAYAFYSNYRQPKPVQKMHVQNSHKAPKIAWMSTPIRPTAGI